MIISDVILGAILGAILWPIVQRVVDSANRAVLGLVLGGLIGGALAWARLGLYAGQVIGAGLGANITPIEQDLGLVFIDALLQTVKGSAIGAIIALSIRSTSFVLTGAGIGFLVSLMLSGGLRLLNQTLLVDPLSNIQITVVVLLGSILTFGLLAGQR